MSDNPLPPELIKKLGEESYNLNMKYIETVSEVYQMVLDAQLKLMSFCSVNPLPEHCGVRQALGELRSCADTLTMVYKSKSKRMMKNEKV